MTRLNEARAQVHNAQRNYDHKTAAVDSLRAQLAKAEDEQRQAWFTVETARSYLADVALEESTVAA